MLLTHIGNSLQPVANIGLATAAAADVRLLLTDSDMPVLGGSALAAALRRLNPNLPVVSMSGIDNRGRNPTEQPGTEFLPKPFQADALLAIVRRMLHDRQNPET